MAAAVERSVSAPRLVGAVALLLLASVAYAGPTLQSPVVANVVERFTRGESVDDAVIALLRTNAGFRDLRRGLEREARTRPAPLVAAFALHAASLGFEKASLEADRFGTKNAFELIEFGCETLRQASPRHSDFELRWQVLATELMTSSTRRLQGSAETFKLGHDSVLFEHAQHVRGGGDPELGLRAARYFQSRFYVWRLTWGVAVVRGQREVSRQFALRPLELTLAELKPLHGHPQFGEEARVRSGDVLLHLRRIDEALALLAEPVKDPRLEYIRRLLRGRHFMEQTQTAEAAREYQAAVQIDPRGRAANLALAGLAYLDAQPDVAARLVTMAETNAQDPWVDYMYPGATGLEARLAALQQEARGAR